VVVVVVVVVPVPVAVGVPVMLVSCRHAAIGHQAGRLSCRRSSGSRG
jgi:hypothetical protein